MAYERDTIRRMHGYVPGKQPATAQTIKLNTNENPYPPTDAVFETLRAIGPDQLRRYPEPLAEEFRAEAAAPERSGRRVRLRPIERLEAGAIRLSPLRFTRFRKRACPGRRRPHTGR